VTDRLPLKSPGAEREGNRNRRGAGSMDGKVWRRGAMLPVRRKVGKKREGRLPLGGEACETDLGYRAKVNGGKKGGHEDRRSTS